MPLKSREYYLATSPSRDFVWLLFKLANGRGLRKKLAPPSSANAVPKARRAKKAEPGPKRSPPAEGKARKQAAQSRLKPAGPKKQHSSQKRSRHENVDDVWSDR
ncbi:hypothetical protein VTH06DRAFT_5971, partial [Thermothelomyces fergusii]